MTPLALSLPSAALFAMLLLGCAGDQDPCEPASDHACDVADSEGDSSIDPTGTGPTSPSETRPPTMASTSTPDWVEARRTCGNGTCEEHEDATFCPEDCADGPVALHDPLRDDLLRFPDDFLTRPDPSSATGLRVHLDRENFPGRNIWHRNINPLFEMLDELDGFGTLAGGFFRFSSRLDPATVNAADGPTPDFASEAFIAGWFDEDGSFHEIPVEAVLLPPRRTTIVVRPMLPLPPGRQAVFAIGAGLTSPDGDPVLPSPWLTALLDGSAPHPADQLQERYTQAMTALLDAQLISAPEDMVAMTVFTTQTIHEEALAAAAAIRQQGTSVTSREGCEQEQEWRVCRFRMASPHWRSENGILDFDDPASPVGSWEIPVAVFLPLPGAEDEDGNTLAPPYRTTIYSHGLGGSRFEAHRLAEHTLAYGLAAIAIDAPFHGDHPTVVDGTSETESVLDFLGFGGSSGSIFDPRALRDNFRTATLDKLALLQLISEGLDVTGDGTVDLDQSGLAFIGMSLGSIMGPEFLALSRGIGAAVIAIGGARVTDIIQFSEFSGAISLYAGAGNREDVNRALFPLLQTAIERGDPGNWASHVISGRFDNEPPIQLIKGMSLEDEVVPDETSVLMARILDLVHVPPVYRPVGFIEVHDERSLAGNLPDGGTAGYVQFDTILRDGEWQPSRHARMPDNPVGLVAWNTFLKSWFDTGVGQIVDPYAALGRERP